MCEWECLTLESSTKPLRQCAKSFLSPPTRPKKFTFPHTNQVFFLTSIPNILEELDFGFAVVACMNEQSPAKLLFLISQRINSDTLTAFS